MDNQRLILFLVFSFSIMMLWDAWERQHAPMPAPAVQTQAQSGSHDIPAGPKAAQPAAVAPVADATSLARGARIVVKTDLFQAEIDTVGGDIRHLELVRHKDDQDKSKNFVLLDERRQPQLYIAQSGLIGTGLPNHKTVFTANAGIYELPEGRDSLEIRLSWQDVVGVQVDKVYTFHRGSYVTDVRYDIHNATGSPIESSAYFQLVHDSESNQGSMMMPTFTGAAYFTEADKFKKVSFDDMKKANLSKNANDGWIGIVQHYFVGAWLPKAGVAREYYTKQVGNNLYSAGTVQSVGAITPGTSGTVSARLFAGPQEQTLLNEVAPDRKSVV